MPATDVQLSDEQISFYKDNGYIKFEQLIDRDEAEAMKRVFVEAIRQYDASHNISESGDGTAYAKVLNQKVNIWQVNDEIRKIVFDPRFAEIARQLTGAKRIRLFHDHALLKMPGDSKPTPWHQDTVYWPMNEDGALSIWLAFDDVSEENGCLSFIPNSRDLGRLDHVDLTNPYDIIKTHLTPEQAENIKVMEMPMGSATFHDGLTFHFAGANQSPAPRHALAIIYMPDGTTFNGNDHVVTRGLGLKAGDKLEGEMFPVLAG